MSLSVPLISLVRKPLREGQTKSGVGLQLIPTPLFALFCRKAINMCTVSQSLAEVNHNQSPPIPPRTPESSSVPEAFQGLISSERSEKSPSFARELDLRLQSNALLAQAGVISHEEEELARHGGEFAESLSEFPYDLLSNTESPPRATKGNSDKKSSKEYKLNPYIDFNRGASDHDKCKVLLSMAIPGKRHRIPGIFIGMMPCDCWKCRGCGPKHRRQWFEVFAQHLQTTIDSGQALYLSQVPGKWDTHHKKITRATEGDNLYAAFRHETGVEFTLSTAAVDDYVEVVPELIPYVLAKLLERTELGRRPVHPSMAWKKPSLAQRVRTGLVGLGVIKDGLLEKVKEICQRTGARSKRWGTRKLSPQIVDGFDEGWQNWGGWKAIVSSVLGVHGASLCYDADDPLEKRLLRLWEGWPEEDEMALT